MKKLVLSFCISVLTLSSAFSQGGLLPNGGFENWTTTTIYENPDLWKSSNYDQGVPVAGVSQSADAQHLSKSVHIMNSTLNNGQDTAFSYVYLGELGSSGPEKGIPYSTTVDRINGYYKGMIGANDTAIVLVIKFMAGNIVAMDLGKLYISQSNWTAFTFNLSPVPQDSIFIGFLSSNPFVYPTYANPSTMINFDNVSLSHSINGAGTPLPNFSFESWTPVQSTNPDNWTTINDLAVIYGLTPVSRTTDMNSGSFAAKIETIEVFTDTVPGMLIYGDLVIGDQPTPWPYDANPTTLSGFYKYVPSGADNAFVSFEFYENGTAVGSNMQALSPTGTYTSFSLPTNITGNPDSLLMVFFSGDNTGSALYLDDVQFSGGDVSVNEISGAEFSVFPNPAVDFIQISSIEEGNHIISIIDNNGKLVSTIEGSGSRLQIDTRHLANGFYTIQVNTQGKISSSRFAVIK